MKFDNKPDEAIGAVLEEYVRAVEADVQERHKKNVISERKIAVVFGFTCGAFFGLLVGAYMPLLILWILGIQ